jgi:hypothetical protein
LALCYHKGEFSAMPSRLFDVLYLTACSVLFFGLFHKAASPAPFGYDESDYMMCVRLGIAGNYLDTNAMSLPQFVNAGLKLARKESTRTEVSEYVRGRRDSMFLRHYHGPLNSYWLIAASALGGSGEARMRLASLAFHWLTFLTVYAGILWVFGPRFRIAAVAASACYLFCVNNITTVAAVSSHAPFLWLSIVTLFTISKLAAAPSRKRFYWAAALCAVSLCALEFAVLLFLVLAITVAFVRKEFFAQWTRRDYLRFARNTVLLIAGVCLVLWPSSILKLTIVQGFAFIVFMSATRRESFGGDVAPLDGWRLLLRQIPADMLTVSVCVAAGAFLLWRSPRRAQLLPFFVYALLLTMAIFRNTSEGARYISSLFAPLYVTAAVLLVERAKRIPTVLQAGAVAALFGVLLFVSHREVQARVARSSSVDDRAASLIGFMRGRPSAKVLVPFECLPSLQYYFPDASIRSYSPDATRARILAAADSYEAVCLYETGNSAPDAAPSVWRAGLVTPKGRLTCYLRP